MPVYQFLHSSDLCRKTKRSQWSTQVLLIAAIVLGMIDMLLKVPGLIGFLILGLAAALSWSQYKALHRRWRWAARFLVAGGAACLAAMWLSVFSTPAHAQFFNRAEGFFNTNFSAASAAVPIVFFALRALYILYLAVSFIGVINAVRQDEDWQTVARTPALVVVVITLADILTGVVIGGA